MKPGERVRVISEIADGLMLLPWADAQLTLDQFGFDTYDPTNHPDFEPRLYFIEMVKMKAADESSLHELHEYLMGQEAAPTAQQVSDRPWGSQPVSVFVTHRHEDAHFVGDVKRLLGSRFGIDAFVAHDDIHPSKTWREVIKAALKTCHMLVAVLHPKFHESQWCDQEVGWALGRNVPVLPVRREGVERRDGFLEEHQDVTLSDKHGSGEWWLADRIFEVVLADPRTHTVGVKALAEAFANSRSYDSTRKMWGLIEKEPHLDSEQLRRLEYGVQTNSQVYEAVRTPDGTPIPKLVEELVARLEPPQPVDPWKSPDPWSSEPPF